MEPLFWSLGIATTIYLSWNIATRISNKIAGLSTVGFWLFWTLGAYIVNIARGKICNKDAIAKALKSGQLSGYAGDVWFPQPAPNDHVWRTMPNHGMTPHTSGTSLSAQARYAAGTREILECFFDKKPIRDPYLIVKDGQLAGMGAHSYTKGSATGGSEEAAKYKK